MRVVVCALLYGDHFRLHQRFLSGLPQSLNARLWCNQVCPETRALLSAAPASWQITFREENVPKYRAMREMFDRVSGDWVVWFDDDSWVEKAGWFDASIGFIRAHHGAVCLGPRWGVHYLPGQWEFVAASPWFRGREAERIDGRPGVWFAQGAYWWLRTDALRALDWPDPRLSHNGGDALLGEALRQNGFDLEHWDYGVLANDAPRRGLSERPAGSAVEVRQ